MTIGIDIRVLANKNKSGVEEYTENLLSRLLRLDEKIKFILFHASLKNNLPDYEWMHLPNVELRVIKLPNKFLFSSAKVFNKPFIDRLIGGVDVFFSPHFFLASLSPNCRRVTTFHDLSYIRFKNFLSWRRNIWHRLEMNPLRQARLSDKIIAVSESTKNDLIENYKIDSNKIKVIHSGISPAIKKVPAEKLYSFQRLNSLPDKFILFLGKLEPRKNIVGLIRAFNLLKGLDGFEDLNLVIVGSPGWLYKNIFDEARQSPHQDRIIFKGHVRDQDRAYYYSLASVFVYPSFFEGFGFPPLEAMACGTPVVASFNSSLPEVIGNGGILIDPHNTVDISTAIKVILTDASLRNSIIKKGHQRVQNFTWERSARETLNCLLSA